MTTITHPPTDMISENGLDYDADITSKEDRFRHRIILSISQWTYQFRHWMILSILDSGRTSFDTGMYCTILDNGRTSLDTGM